MSNPNNIYSEEELAKMDEDYKRIMKQMETQSQEQAKLEKEEELRKLKIKQDEFDAIIKENLDNGNWFQTPGGYYRLKEKAWTALPLTVRLGKTYNEYLELYPKDTNQPPKKTIGEL